MAYYITIDQGNTRTKVTVFDDMQYVCHQSLASLSVDDMAAVIDTHCRGGAPVGGVIYCTVAGHNDSLMQWLRDRYPHVVELTHDTPTGVDISAYSSTTLGLDRVAAMAGARAICPDQWLLVVDAGTAVTYDVVSPQGAFVGGNIAPGANMRLKALHHFTSRLPLVSPDDMSPECLGNSTTTALANGAMRGIEAETLFYLGTLPKNRTLILTGGSGSHLAQLIAERMPDVCFSLHLVAIGLLDILMRNIDNTKR